LRLKAGIVDSLTDGLRFSVCGVFSAIFSSKKKFCDLSPKPSVGEMGISFLEQHH